MSVKKTTAQRRTKPVRATVHSQATVGMEIMNKEETDHDFEPLSDEDFKLAKRLREIHRTYGSLEKFLEAQRQAERNKRIDIALRQVEELKAFDVPEVLPHDAGKVQHYNQILGAVKQAEQVEPVTAPKPHVPFGITADQRRMLDVLYLHVDARYRPEVAWIESELLRLSRDIHETRTSMIGSSKTLRGIIERNYNQIDELTDTISDAVTWFEENAEALEGNKADWQAMLRQLNDAYVKHAHTDVSTPRLHTKT